MDTSKFLSRKFMLSMLIQISSIGLVAAGHIEGGDFAFITTTNIGS